MRADGQCPTCGLPIRRAIHAATRTTLLLDPIAIVSGRYGVVDWVTTPQPARSIPIIAINPTRETMPTRYELHHCRNGAEFDDPHHANYPGEFP